MTEDFESPLSDGILMERKIKRLLIANRSEIAIRVFRAAT